MIKKIFLVLCVMFLSISVFAVDPAPLAMLKTTSSKMLAELDKNIGRLKSDDKLVYELVDRVLLPHFDLNAMSRAVVGREYWQGADASTKKEFIGQFTHYVTKTYSAALQSYDGEKMIFLPMRTDASGQSRVQVDSKLMLKSGSPIDLQYRLLKQGNQWLIYDFSVDGISIVQNYNSQFAGTLRQGGMAKLVQQLKARNAKN